jgi:DNA adenine methylase
VRQAYNFRCETRPASDRLRTCVHQLFRSLPCNDRSVTPGKILANPAWRTKYEDATLRNIEVDALSGTGIAPARKASQGTLFPRATEERRAKPFLKWAGGKTRLLAALRESLPPRAFNRYFEPFVGGGALFFDLAPGKAFLGDSNPELINCYQVVGKRPDELIDTLSRFRVSESEFYRIRGLDPDELPPITRAARLIYLNKTCYNGLYRVNKQGQFNTPYGRNSNVTLVDIRNLKAASKLLKKAKLFCAEYQTVLEFAAKGDFVYLDPPYVPVGKFSDFKRYTKNQFHEADHERLATMFRELAARGCFVLLSNSSTEKTSGLYSDFFQRTVQMPRFVNCKGEGRGPVDELLVSNYKPTNSSC